MLEENCDGVQHLVHRLLQLLMLSIALAWLWTVAGEMTSFLTIVANHVSESVEFQWTVILKLVGTVDVLHINQNLLDDFRVCGVVLIVPAGVEQVEL